MYGQKVMKKKIAKEIPENLEFVIFFPDIG